MASSVITAPSPPSRPAASHRAQALATLLQQPRRGKTSAAPKKGLHWLTIGFMIVIHSLALLALLPMFWSWQAVTSLLVLYWVTACLGVTIGYHRLLSHRSFQLPRWLERFFATCLYPFPNAFDAMKATEKLIQSWPQMFYMISPADLSENLETIF